MKINLLQLCLLFGLVTVFAQEESENNKTEVALNDKIDNKNVELEKTEDNIEPTKDKRQIDSKQTNNYANNHRSNTNIEDAEDDPENPHETIYSAKTQQQFLIRPEQSGLPHPSPTYVPLRNYPATLRPHNTQLLEQSQEIQHFSYLHDINRNQPKSLAGKSAHQTLGKRPLGVGRGLTAPTSAAYRHALPEEAEEQRYEVFAPLLQHQQQQQHNSQRQQVYLHANPQQQQQQQRYEIIPEQQFLKLIETELRARAYYEAQLRQQQQQQHHQQQHQQQQQLATNIKVIQEKNNELDRQRYEEKQQDLQHQQQANYVQYVAKVKQQQQQQHHEQHQQEQQQLQHAQEPLTELPPQIAYYQPQISYKTIPNHPLAQSSLEKEIEKLLAANKPSAAALEIIDSSNEPSAVVNRHHQPPSAVPSPIGPTVQTLSTVPYRLNKVQQQQQPQQSHHLLDANHQPFIPSLFQFSENLQTATPIHPTRVPQHIVDAKKLGPVVYPAQTTPSTPIAPPTEPSTHATALAQPTQYYYQDTVSPANKPKAYRIKQPYGLKIVTPTPSLKNSKYLYGRVPFFPSPQDPIKQQQQQQLLEQNIDPSQSSNYLLHNNNNNNNNNNRHGPTPTSKRMQPNLQALPQTSKTLADLKKLHLPQPGGKPLTQAQFQALVDAGYPVTAVPVPVPVPYEQYIKDHPEFEGQQHQPPTAHIADYMQQFMRALSHHQQEQRQQNHQRNNIGGGNRGEPSVKIVSSPTEGSITYLHPIAEEERQRQKQTNDNSN